MGFLVWILRWDLRWVSSSGGILRWDSQVGFSGWNSQVEFPNGIYHDVGFPGMILRCNSQVRFSGGILRWDLSSGLDLSSGGILMWDSQVGLLGGILR